MFHIDSFEIDIAKKIVTPFEKRFSTVDKLYGSLEPDDEAR